MLAMKDQNKKEQRKKKSQYKTKLTISLNILIIKFIILILFLSIFLLKEIDLIENPLKFITKKDNLINIKDECSIIAGRLINTIPDEGVCKNVCISECESFKSKLKKLEFIAQKNSCNKCNCYCGF